MNIRRVTINSGTDLKSNLDEGRFKFRLTDTWLHITISFVGGWITADEGTRHCCSGKSRSMGGCSLRKRWRRNRSAAGTNWFFVDSGTSSQLFLRSGFFDYRRQKVLPVEMKSGISSKRASFEVFINRPCQRLSEYFGVHIGNLRVKTCTV